MCRAGLEVDAHGERLELWSAIRLHHSHWRVLAVEAETLCHMYDAKKVNSDGAMTDILCINVILIVTYLEIVVDTCIAVPVQLSAKGYGEILAESLLYKQRHGKAHRIEARREV